MFRSQARPVRRWEIAVEVSSFLAAVGAMALWVAYEADRQLESQLTGLRPLIGVLIVLAVAAGLWGVRTHGRLMPTLLRGAAGVVLYITLFQQRNIAGIVVGVLLLALAVWWDETDDPPLGTELPGRVR